MYPPPPRPPMPQRHGVPALGVIILCAFCLLAGCVGGAAIASSPEPKSSPAASRRTTSPPATLDETTTAPTLTAVPTPTEASPAPEPTHVTAKARPKPAKPKPKPKPRKTTRAPSTDPRYSTCTEARRHGLGPYYSGRDPEYAWYQDRDHDGVVCES